jgi:citrate lyase subunit beta/citryl-CoA lyase
MNTKMGTAGNKGEKDRSDCYVSLELKTSGGIQINITSKVATLYGEAIDDLCLSVLTYFGIENALLEVEDKGALPFVMAARLEAAVKQVIQTDVEYLPEILPENLYATKKDKLRISRLFLPGNTPSLMINAGIHKPNAIILDLEDAVAPNRKKEARFLVRNALRSLDFMGAERMVRINQGQLGLEDLDYVIPHHINLIMVPKCEDAKYLRMVNERIEAIQKRNHHQHPVWLMPIIESAMGVMKAMEIAQAADNIVAITIGLEDYTADIGAARTNEGLESFFARAQVLNACKANGIQAIDSVFSDVGDMEGLILNVKRSKSLGFDGMGCLHPRQISVIHENFAPNDTELEWAIKVVTSFNEANEKGEGVFAIGSKMIDAPVVKRAQRNIDLAIAMGRLSPDWKM